MRVVRDLFVVLGIHVEADRVAALARVLALQGFTSEELERCARHLATSEDLDEKLRYGGTLTPADFVRARRATAPRSKGDARYGQMWLAKSAELDEQAGRKPMAPKHNGDPLMLFGAPAQKQLPESVREPQQHPNAPKCPKHGRVLVDGDFCAVCEIEKVQRQTG